MKRNDWTKLQKQVQELHRKTENQCEKLLTYPNATEEEASLRLQVAQALSSMAHLIEYVALLEETLSDINTLATSSKEKGEDEPHKGV